MDEALAQTILQNLRSTFVEPEVRRRHAAGQIEALPMPLTAVQVISPLGKAAVVRLNGEARI